jgi:hypothetical protein
MPDFTPALAKGLDARRAVFYGQGMSLHLLDYARPGKKGFDSLVVVPSGWHLHSGKDIGELMVLEVAELGAVTKEKLDKAQAFAINGQVWKMDGDEPRKAPTYPNKRIWVFTVKPTGEQA